MICALAASLLVACGSDSATTSSTPGPSPAAGTWNLSTVNGSPLPYTVQASNPKIEYLSEQLVVSSTGTFTQSGTARYTNNVGNVGTQPITGTGTYVLNGTAATFRFNIDGSTGVGTLIGSTLTLAVSGFSKVFVKQ
jgi:hypothetical protein